MFVTGNQGWGRGGGREGSLACTESNASYICTYLDYTALRKFASAKALLHFSVICKTPLFERNTHLLDLNFKCVIWINMVKWIWPIQLESSDQLIILYYNLHIVNITCKHVAIFVSVDTFLAMVLLILFLKHTYIFNIIDDGKCLYFSHILYAWLHSGTGPSLNVSPSPSAYLA